MNDNNENKKLDSFLRKSLPKDSKAPANEFQQILEKTNREEKSLFSFHSFKWAVSLASFVVLFMVYNYNDGIIQKNGTAFEQTIQTEYEREMENGLFEEDTVGSDWIELIDMV